MCISQVINFPDVNFKSDILDQRINGDSQTEVVANLEGLQHFVNLKRFTGYYLAITDFNFPDLVNLEELGFGVSSAYYYNNFVETPYTLNLSGNSNLKKLSTAGSLVAVNLSNCTKLTDLFLFSTLLTELNLTDCQKLLQIISFCPLTNLVAPNINKIIQVQLVNL